MNRKIFSLILVLAAAVGCHGQVPPASVHSVTLTWNAPVAGSTWSGCTTTAPCVYAVYRCAGTATSCPAPPTSSTSWAEITTPTTRPSGTTFVDTAVTGGDSYTYVVETVQASTSSVPSNTTTANVPQTPVVPSIGPSLPLFYTVAKIYGKPLPAATTPNASFGAVMTAHGLIKQ